MKYLLGAVMLIVFIVFIVTLSKFTQEGGESKFFSLYVRAMKNAETIQDEKEKTEAIKEVKDMRETVNTQAHILIFTSFTLGIVITYLSMV